MFRLLVVATLDGFIAKAPGHAPHEWASPEEQDVFLDEVAKADWGIMGRGTHAAADKPDRRRIVFSSAPTQPEWRRPRQVWINPTSLTPQDLPQLVASVHPLNHGLVLGGTAVHDWFRAHGAIDEIRLTVEPVRFDTGLPIFRDQSSGDPRLAVERMGYQCADREILNEHGTELSTWRA